MATYGEFSDEFSSEFSTGRRKLVNPQSIHIREPRLLKPGRVPIGKVTADLKPTDDIILFNDSTHGVSGRAMNPNGAMNFTTFKEKRCLDKSGADDYFTYSLRTKHSAMTVVMLINPVSSINLNYLLNNDAAAIRGFFAYFLNGKLYFTGSISSYTLNTICASGEWTLLHIVLDGTQGYLYKKGVLDDNTYIGAIVNPIEDITFGGLVSTPTINGYVGKFGYFQIMDGYIMSAEEVADHAKDLYKFVSPK